MMTADPTRADKSEDFAIEDFKGYLDSLHRSEEIGEKRLEFFVTFASAVLGGVGLLAKRNDSIDFALAARLAEWALPAVLVLGILTFLRMLHRDSRTDEYVDNLERIRRRFNPDREITPRKHRRMINGGLTPVIIAVNSLLLSLWAGIATWRSAQDLGLTTQRFAVPWTALTAAFVFVLAWGAGVLCKTQCEERRGLWAKK